MPNGATAHTATHGTGERIPLRSTGRPSRTNAMVLRNSLCPQSNFPRPGEGQTSISSRTIRSKQPKRNDFQWLYEYIYQTGSFGPVLCCSVSHNAIQNWLTYAPIKRSHWCLIWAWLPGCLPNTNTRSSMYSSNNAVDVLKKMYVFEILLTFSQKNGSVGRRRNIHGAGRLLNAKQWHYKLPSLQGERVEVGADTLTTLRQQLRPCQMYTPPNHISK